MLPPPFRREARHCQWSFSCLFNFIISNKQEREFKRMKRVTIAYNLQEQTRLWQSRSVEQQVNECTFALRIQQRTDIVPATCTESFISPSISQRAIICFNNQQKIPKQDLDEVRSLWSVHLSLKNTNFKFGYAHREFSRHFSCCRNEALQPRRDITTSWWRSALAQKLLGIQ